MSRFCKKFAHSQSNAWISLAYNSYCYFLSITSTPKFKVSCYQLKKILMKSLLGLTSTNIAFIKHSKDIGCRHWSFWLTDSWTRQANMNQRRNVKILSRWLIFKQNIDGYWLLKCLDEGPFKEFAWLFSWLIIQGYYFPGSIEG